MCACGRAHAIQRVVSSLSHWTTKKSPHFYSIATVDFDFFFLLSFVFDSLHFISFCFWWDICAFSLDTLHDITVQYIVQCTTSGTLHWIFVVSLVNESARNRKQNVEKGLIARAHTILNKTTTTTKMRRPNCASSSSWLFESHCIAHNLYIDNSQVEWKEVRRYFKTIQINNDISRYKINKLIEGIQAVICLVWFIWTTKPTHHH